MINAGTYVAQQEAIDLIAQHSLRLFHERNEARSA